MTTTRLIRRSALARRGGGHDVPRKNRPLPGDEFLPDATAQVTHAATIHARPAEIWPWLAQMGCRRGGFYSIDVLDNGAARSAREIHGDLQEVAAGDVLPATPHGEEGFEVLRAAPLTELVLGALVDPGAKRQLPFHAQRPSRFWHVTWAFVLEPRADGTTRLYVRARAAFPDGRMPRARAAYVMPIHHLMQTSQLRHLAARAEGRLARDDWRDVLDGAAGAAVMAVELARPFRRGARNHWGVDAATAGRSYPGDELLREPRWSWTHGIEVNAPAEKVWPWVAQIGADRGGFYSYQWLENLVGCKVRNAETVHPEWEVREGGALRLHPKFPPLRITSVRPGRWIVAFIDPVPQPNGRWMAASWLFYVEPLGARKCRVISRYRCATSDDLASRLQFGAAIIEPIGFAMDRRMLLGIKQRAES
jgi:hypothetical protein